MARKVIAWIVYAICEAILITAFILFGSSLETNVLVLDIVVASLGLSLFFVDIFVPWNDERTMQLGSMGVRWTVSITYVVLSLAAMYVFRYHSFVMQLLVQGGLLALLLLGVAAVLRTREQISDVYVEEKSKLIARDSVKKAWQQAVFKMEGNADFPSELRERARRMLEEMRFLSPTSNPDIQDIDSQLVEIAESLGRKVTDFRLNRADAEDLLGRAERLLKVRKGGTE